MNVIIKIVIIIIVNKLFTKGNHFSYITAINVGPVN